MHVSMHACKYVSACICVSSPTSVSVCMYVCMYHTYVWPYAHFVLCGCVSLRLSLSLSLSLSQLFTVAPTTCLARINRRPNSPQLWFAYGNFLEHCANDPSGTCRTFPLSIYEEFITHSLTHSLAQSIYNRSLAYSPAPALTQLIHESITNYLIACFLAHSLSHSLTH